MSCLWKQFPDAIVHQKTLAKKAPIFFWFQVGDLNISDSFYKPQNLNWWPVCPVITYWTYTCLSPWALRSDLWNTGRAIIHYKKAGSVGWCWKALIRRKNNLVCIWTPIYHTTFHLGEPRPMLFSNKQHYFTL